MKTEEQIKQAQEVIRAASLNVVARSAQDMILMGMSAALSWVDDSPFGSTLQRLIDGEEIVHVDRQKQNG